MIFDVVKAGAGFSKWGSGDWSRTLKYEVVPQERYQLDIGDHWVVIGAGYHRFKATERHRIVPKVVVSTDKSILDLVEGEERAVGVAAFHEGSGDPVSPYPDELTFYVVVEAHIFDAMARTPISGPGAASIDLDIDHLDYGNDPDGCHQIWKLEPAKKRTAYKPVERFRFDAAGFWTSETATYEANEERTTAWLAESSDPQDRKLAYVAKPQKADPVLILLRQCRALLLALLILGGLAIFRTA